MGFFRAVAIVFLCSLLQRTNAACANQCSGHGRCTNYKPTFGTAPNYFYLPSAGGLGYDSSVTKKDSCTCFLRSEDGSSVYDWTGGDCSLKTCPGGPAVGGVPYAGNDHTQTVECSGVGTCDRQTGECQCQVGFTGKNCGRRKCPNDCNGNGKCLSLFELVRELNLIEANLAWDASSGTITYSSAFDKSLSSGCLCDAGFRGADCSLHECPSSEDPMGGYGSADGRECSGRGRCNYNTGACQCFPGYYGSSCEAQHTNFA